MQAIILAGGQGTRLRPYTVSLPKPLVPIGDHPIIDIVLRQLKTAGFEDVVISTGHLSDLVQAYCGDGSKWRLRVRYVREEHPLSTAGPLRLIEGLEENFLVVNGDILTSLKFEAIWRDHLDSHPIATLGICQRHMAVDFGVVELGEENELKRYTEKPRLEYHVAMGINVLNRKCITYIKPGEALGLPELYLRMQTAGETLKCYVSKDFWLDIGRPEDYQSAQDRLAEDPQAFLSDAN